jgi:parallel beta-helix repeat protein
MTTYTVNNLNDSGNNSLRSAIIYANLNPNTIINFSIDGTIKLKSNLPPITNPTSIIGNTISNKPSITIDGNKKYNIIEISNTKTCIIDNLCLINSKNSGIFINKSCDNTINNCWIGLDTLDNSGSNNFGIFLFESNNNTIGSNPLLNQLYFSNIISSNQQYGVYLVKSNKNKIQNNIIGLSPTFSTKLPNHNGIKLYKSSLNTIGGKVFIDKDYKKNNPTGNKGTVTPEFVRPLLGNIISGNNNNGIELLKSIHNNIYGNFIGTDNTGLLNFGNKNNGIYTHKSNYSLIGGCCIDTNPFIYYNVIGWNGNNGIDINCSNYSSIQGNFLGIGADNQTAIPNLNGLLVSGNSKGTVVGGVIPLGNVISGNKQYGIYITDKISDFTSINTFCGLKAFGTELPNGSDGILMDSYSNNIKLNTNVISGNNGNGVSIKGNSNNILITSNIIGMETNGFIPLPNNLNGIKISENANNISFAINLPSIIVRNIISANNGYGILIKNNAYKIFISLTTIGLDYLSENFVPNRKGGIMIKDNVNNCKIGDIINYNYICDKNNFAIYATDNTKDNLITNNFINVNKLLFPNEHNINVVNLSNNNVVYNNNVPYI